MNEFVNSHKIRYSLIILAELTDIRRRFFAFHFGFFRIIATELAAEGFAAFFDALLAVFFAAIVAIESFFSFHDLF